VVCIGSRPADLEVWEATVRKKTATLAAVALAVAGNGAVTACSGSDEGSGESGEVSGTVTLWYLEDPRMEFLDAIKVGFEEKYPGTTVEMVEVPEDGYVTKVDTAVLAHKPPDVGFVYEPRWMKAGTVIDLDDTVAEYDVATDSFNQVAMSECELDGSLYCLGSLTGSVVLLYNKDLFDQAGVEYPSPDQPMTVDEFDEEARAIHEALPDVYGGVAGAPFWWASRAYTYSEDGTEIAGQVDDDSTMHMWDVLAEQARDGVQPLPEQTDLVLPADMLGAGDAAMAVTDFEYAANALEEAGYSWGAAPPPVEQEGDSSFVFVGTDKYGVFKDAENPTAARALVAYIATEGQRLRIEAADQPPLDQSLLDQWAGDDPSRQEVVAVLHSSTGGGIFVPGFWEVGAGMLDVFSQMANGEADADAIHEQASAWQDKLDRQWETWNDIG
jgi:multiple sugar transport system substrate-binding protein